MNKNRKTSLLIVLLLTMTTRILAISEGDLLFNEVMISNLDELMKDYDYPDSWIELYNPTSSSIDLNGMTISTTGKEPYTINASTKVPARGYAVIYCDKRATKSHTSFRLDAEGGTLALTSGATLIAQMDYPAMIAPQVGYARISVTSETWRWTGKATPGSINVGPFADEILPDPVFSHNGGVMSGRIHLDIQMPSTGTFPPDTRIYITFNGSEPTIEAEAGESFSLDIDSTTIIRAKLMSASAISPRSVSHSYIFHPRRTSLPIISILTDSMHLYDSKYGLFSDATNTGNKPNYEHDWRRPINVEYLGTEGETPRFNQLGEVAVSGASSRALLQKSMKLYAHKRFGTKHYDGALWNDKPWVRKTKSLILRNGGSNSYGGRILDAFTQRLFGTHIGNLDWQAYEPAITYINGQYYGFLGLRERSNEDYVWANYDGEEDIELVDHYTNTTNENFAHLKSLCSQNTSGYMDFEPIIDMDEWANMLCLQIFAANTDWPFNNMSLWRKNDGGKWRWIVKDIDYIGWAVRPQLTDDVLNFNYFRYLTMSGPKTAQEYKTASKYSGAFYLFKKLLPMTEVRDMIVDKLAVALGDYLKPTVSTAMLWEMHDEAYDELDATMNLYRPTLGGARVTRKLKELDAFLKARPRKVYDHMTEYYGLGRVIPMTLAANHLRVKINDVDLTEGDFDGAYFSDRELRLSAAASNAGWKMTTFRRMDDGVMQPNQEEVLFNQPTVSLWLKDYTQCDSVALVAFRQEVSEFDTRLNELAIDADELRDWSSHSTICLDEPDCAYANISGIDQLPASKKDNLHAFMDFYDARGNYFRKKIILNLQGGAEANRDKKNLAISFCEDDWEGEVTPEISFGNWVMQDEFHLKAFYNDYFRGISAIGYKLYNQMTLSLGDECYAWQRGLSETERQNPDFKIQEQARCFPDAFPCIVYINGDYYGTYAWQLKKQRRNMNQTKNIATHIHLDGTLNDTQIFGGEVNWSKFEIRNPKDLYLMDGADYDGDNPGEIMDSTSPAYSGKNKQIRCNEVKQHIKSLSAYYQEIAALEETGDDPQRIMEVIEQRFDITGMIDYMVFSLVTSNYEGFSKNWQWFTYNGEKWFVAPYDLDLTFGYNEEAMSLWPASQSSRKHDYRMLNIDSNGPMRWIKKYYWDKVRDRYNQLRDNGILTADNIMRIVSDWYERVGDDNRQTEWMHWPQSPCLVNYTDSKERIRTWISERLRLEDAYLNNDSIVYELTISNAQWATVCLPFEFAIPQGLDVYAVDGIDKDGTSLTTTPITITEGCRPYLVHGAEGTYRLTGNEIVDSPNCTNGLLTGTLTDIYAPKDSYVLQQTAGRLGFYRVGSENSIPVTAHHAYLQPVHNNQPKLLSLPYLDTAIQDCPQDEAPIGECHNLWGIKTKADRTGFIIDRGRLIYAQ